ncbi:MAG: TetR/AcrR family transcriptional regulator [Spirochaetes bacterium]|nr:TetR/AcrR family transcriptional regulator [Spirochaetota bacterium]
MQDSDRLNRILEASLAVFAQYGYRKASMEDIADRLGMTKGNLYFYCRNKLDLYEKSVALGLLRWQNRVRDAVEREEDIMDKFTALGLKSYEYLSEDDTLRSIIMNDPAIQSVTPSEDRFPSIGQASYAMLRGIIQRGVDEGVFRRVDIDQVAGFLYSVYCMFIIKTYVKSEGHTAQGMYRAGIDLILKGLLDAQRETPKAGKKGGRRGPAGGR